MGATNIFASLTNCIKASARQWTTTHNEMKKPFLAPLTSHHISYRAAVSLRPLDKYGLKEINKVTPNKNNDLHHWEVFDH